jgi:hypothetical protein
MNKKNFKRILTALLLIAVMAFTTVASTGCVVLDWINGLKKNPSAVDPVNDNYRTFYQIFVGSFSDGNNDGIGDLQGIINRMDYLND